ncbi:hypothetical protein V3W47_19320 [Deinococcus sp. YIM 134068]|uniref:hypothetical protein n=1 Tax=Deinococcus lichenicola TaxID=3118910 RepID=UPI002F94BA87
MPGVNPLLLRSMIVTGLLIAALNVVFAGVEYGFGTLPAWFWLSQLLLIPAMLVPARVFPEAAATPAYARRAGLYALGWSAPYAVYKFTGDALRPGFSADASLFGVVFTCLLFGLIFAAIRRPQ